MIQLKKGHFFLLRKYILVKIPRKPQGNKYKTGSAPRDDLFLIFQPASILIT